MGWVVGRGLSDPVSLVCARVGGVCACVTDSIARVEWIVIAVNGLWPCTEACFAGKTFFSADELDVLHVVCAFVSVYVRVLLCSVHAVSLLVGRDAYRCDSCHSCVSGSHAAWCCVDDVRWVIASRAGKHCQPRLST